MTSVRLSDIIADVLIEPVDPPQRLSDITVDVLAVPDDPPQRLSDIIVDVLGWNPYKNTVVKGAYIVGADTTEKTDAGVYQDANSGSYSGQSFEVAASEDVAITNIRWDIRNAGTYELWVDSTLVRTFNVLSAASYDFEVLGPDHTITIASGSTRTIKLVCLGGNTNWYYKNINGGYTVDELTFGGWIEYDNNPANRKQVPARLDYEFHVGSSGPTPISESIPAYIAGTAPSVLGKPCYLVGTHVGTSFVRAYVGSGSSVSKLVRAYIHVVTEITKSKPAFIINAIPADSSVGCFVDSNPRETSSVGAFINVGEPTSNAHSCYVCGNVDGVVGASSGLKRSYIEGLSYPSSGDHLCFVFGGTLEAASVPAYVVGSGNAQQSGVQPSFIYGDGASSSVSAFIYQTGIEDSSINCCVVGEFIATEEEIVLAYVSGRPVIFTSGSVGAHIVGAQPLATSESKLCYIYNPALVGHWPLDDGMYDEDSVVLLDVSESGNHGGKLDKIGGLPFAWGPGPFGGNND